MSTIAMLMLSSAFANENVVGELSGYPEFNVQNFRPSVDSVPYFWVTDSTISTKTFFYKAVYSYTDSPFTYVDYNNNEYDVVSSLNELDFIGGFARDNFRVGVIVPLYINATGFRADQLTQMITSGAASDPIVESTSLGDVTVDAKYRFRSIPLHGTGLFTSVRATLPTGNSYLPLSASGTMVDIEIGADKQVDQVHLAANIGHRQMGDADLTSATFGSSVYGRFGAGYQSDPDSTGVALEYVTGSVYGESGSVGQEAVASVFKPIAGQVVRGGFGWGLGSGISTPKFRVLFSVQPHKPVNLDSDGDGILDVDDQCPTVPEDLDGVKDSDGCIDLTAVTVNVVDAKGKAIKKASWTVASDTGLSGETFNWQVMDDNNVEILATAEGYSDLTYTAEVQNVDKTSITIELVADVGTLLVKAVDADGNPIKAGWLVKGKKPAIKKSDIAHTVSPGDMRIQVRAKGFKPVTKKATIVTGQETIVEVQMQASLANVDGNKITIDDSVYFATGSQVILEKSHKLLDDVAHILEEHPSIVKLEIEGHTDSVGNDTTNKTLSQKRAEAVRTYLIGKNIQENRLHAIGYGEEKPIATNDTSDGRAENRRVHFHIAEQDHSKEHHGDHDEKSNSEKEQSESTESTEKKLKTNESTTSE